MLVGVGVKRLDENKTDQVRDSLALYIAASYLSLSARVKYHLRIFIFSVQPIHLRPMLVRSKNAVCMIRAIHIRCVENIAHENSFQSSRPIPVMALYTNPTFQLQ